MSDRGIDTELMTAGFDACYEQILDGPRDFVGVSLRIAAQLGKPIWELRPYLRAWYSGVLASMEQDGFDIPDISTAAEAAEAAIWLQRWSPGLSNETPIAVEPAELPSEDELRTLMGLALTAPTPDAVMNFAGFVSRMRRFAPFNVQMIYTQRPGAGLVASRRDWARDGRTIRPGAIPILVLRPMGPIEHVFEQLDTDPPIPRVPSNDAFAATGELAPERLEKLIVKLGKPTKRNLTVRVHRTLFGANLAGWIMGAGIAMSNDAPSVQKQTGSATRGSSWNISINGQLSETEQFVTLLHELGHLFCGHLGPFSDNNKEIDEFGWPDRRYLPHAAREIEAELVAWWLADREGLTTGSPIYLRPYLEQAGEAVSMVDVDRVTRAVARVRGYLGDRQ